MVTLVVVGVAVGGLEKMLVSSTQDAATSKARAEAMALAQQKIAVPGWAHNPTAPLCESRRHAGSKKLITIVRYSRFGMRELLGFLFFVQEAEVAITVGYPNPGVCTQRLQVFLSGGAGFGVLLGGLGLCCGTLLL